MIAAVQRDVDDLEMIPKFEDGMVAVRRDASSLAVVALAIGASEAADSSFKGSVFGLIQAADQISNAKNVGEVKKGLQALKIAVANKGADKELTWSKVASLKPLMKYALPSLSTEIKRLARNEKTFLRGSNAQKVIDDSTIMVAVALGCRENVDETQAPDEEKIWRQYCERLAESALEFNKRANEVVAKQGAFDDMKDAFKVVEETCSSTCHEKFGGQSAE